MLWIVVDAETEEVDKGYPLSDDQDGRDLAKLSAVSSWDAHRMQSGM